jgi:hypothetical protein
MRPLRNLVVALIAVGLAGCVTQPMGTPQPSMTTLEQLRSSNLPAMNVGTFAPAPGLSNDQSMHIRGLTLVSPFDKSFALYLGKTIEADLSAAGKFDAASDLVLNGVLTRNDVDAPIGTGTGALGAKFSLSRAGTIIFERDLAVDAKWDSAFLGAIAIPEAANHYSELYDMLARSLFSNADFVAAATKK